MQLARKRIGAQCACSGQAHNRAPLFLRTAEPRVGSEKDASGLNGARASGVGEVVSLRRSCRMSRGARHAVQMCQAEDT